MIRARSLRSKVLAAVLALVAACTPALASAQDVPSYAVGAAPASQDEQVSGRILSIDGAYDITVADDRGFTDKVRLRQGTIINPTGLTLTSGMSVTIRGYNAGSYFMAVQIDTPYQYGGPLPTPVYYGPGWWYPGFAFGYGPSFSLFLSFGYGYAVRGPWYGGWWVNPYFRSPWIGYRPPWPYCGYYGRPTPYVGYYSRPVPYGAGVTVGVRPGGVPNPGRGNVTVNGAYDHRVPVANRPSGQNPGYGTSRSGSPTYGYRGSYPGGSYRGSAPVYGYRGTNPGGTYRGGSPAGGSSGGGYRGGYNGGGGYHGGGGGIHR